MRRRLRKQRTGNPKQQLSDFFNKKYYIENADDFIVLEDGREVAMPYEFVINTIINGLNEKDQYWIIDHLERLEYQFYDVEKEIIKYLGFIAQNIEDDVYDINF